MTVLEKVIMDTLVRYGFTRHCKCYKVSCLVIPESMIKLAVDTIASHVQLSAPWKGYTREVTEKGGEKE